MKKFDILWKILKITNIDKVVLSFFIYYIIIAVLIYFFEPTITHLQDAFWFGFVSFSTVGYGDYTATILLTRILTASLILYGIVVLALIPGVLVTYFTEISKAKESASIMEFFQKLENLPNLTHEELTEISAAVKKKLYK